jgi:hypothetical protein
MYIIMAWQRISPEVTRTSFKCCKSSAVDGTDMLWNGSEEDGDVRSECDKDEDTDCEDGNGDSDW